MIHLTFKPKPVTKALLNVLPERAREVVIQRFGLGENAEPATLEAIGKRYGITRERVRQIENYAIATIRKSDVFQSQASIFRELETLIEELGGIAAEEELLAHAAKDASTRNHIHFLLVVGEQFIRRKEDEEFRHRWYVDEGHAQAVHQALRNLCATLTDDDLIPERDLLAAFLKELQIQDDKYRREEVVRRWLKLARKLDRNPLGEWGLATSHNVRAKGMRDYAYLVIKRHGSPMHFREVAQAITELFNRKAHEATCHNELIKDPRFVLVGRGLYALHEWGYANGVVKDVIADVLKKYGPLSRDQIIDLVRKERYVKDNTILVNLQDANLFEKTPQGTYALR